MAELRKVTIEIVDSTGKGGDAPKSVQGTPIDASQAIKPDKGEQSEGALLGKSVFVNQAFALAKREIVSEARFELNRYMQLEENYLGQQDWQNFERRIGKASSLLTTVGAGFMVGGWIGAGIASVGWGVSQATSWRREMRSYEMSLNASNAQRENSLSRLGALTEGGRDTEN